jgi:hypothetical protein
VECLILDVWILPYFGHLNWTNAEDMERGYLIFFCFFDKMDIGYLVFELNICVTFFLRKLKKERKKKLPKKKERKKKLKIKIIHEERRFFFLKNQKWN